MEYFIYCRDAPGTEALLEELAEAHWSFMDGYADVMIARGPTTDPDGEVHTGSMHMVDLPDAEAADVFAFEEPYYRAGVYAEVLKRRWRNVLGRTMWEFAGTDGGRRFLIIGHGADGIETVPGELVQRRRRYLRDGGYLDRFIERGPLLSEDGERWMGSAMLVELPDRASVDALLAEDPCVLEGLYARVDVHPWEFGGRPQPGRELTKTRPGPSHAVLARIRTRRPSRGSGGTLRQSYRRSWGGRSHS